MSIRSKSTNPRFLIVFRLAMGTLLLGVLLINIFGQRLNNLEIPIQSNVGTAVAFNPIGMWRKDGGDQLIDQKNSLYSQVDVPLNVAGVKQIVAGTLRTGDVHLNAPFQYQQKDFPVVMDRGNEAIVWMISQFTSDPIVNMNIFYLLMFFTNFLLFATGILIWRGKLSFWDIIVSVLFCLTPFHFVQGQFFIMNQGGLILGVAIVLRILSGRRVNFLALVGTALSISMFGMYWAFFFAGLLSLVCMFSLRHIKTRLNLFRLWLLVFISTSGAAFIDFYPSLVYWGKYGATSVVGRSIIQNDFWPFRVMDLVLFPTYSIVKIPLFSRSVLQNSPVSGEASGLFAPLGIVVLLLAIILLGKSLRSGMSSAVADYGLSEDKISKDQLMFLVLGLVLIPSVGSVGGFGTILNNFGVSPIKSWERIAVVFQILALNFVVIFLNNYGTFLRTRDTKVRSQGMKPRGLRGNAVSIVLVVATFFTLISSIPVGWDNDFGVTKSIFDSDRSFFHQVEEVVGDGMVFSFPVETFPEGPEACTSIPYASLIGNMYTQKVRWSSGAVRGRDSEWQTVMNGIPLEQSVNRLADLGFTGVIIDRRGYSPEAFQVLMEEITSHLNDMPLLSKDSRWVFTEIEDFFKNNDSEQTNNGYERVVRTKESTAALSAGVSASSPAYTCSRP